MSEIKVTHYVLTKTPLSLAAKALREAEYSHPGRADWGLYSRQLENLHAVVSGGNGENLDPRIIEHLPNPRTMIRLCAKETLKEQIGGIPEIKAAEIERLEEGAKRLAALLCEKNRGYKTAAIAVRRTVGPTARIAEYKDSRVIQP